MRKLLIAALIVLPLLVILTLPSGLVIPRFDPPPAIGNYGGTIWSGQARWRQAGQVPMALEWRWAWGRQWNWLAFDSESRIEGQWRPGQGINLSDVRGRLAIERLDLEAWLPLSPPQGFVSLTLDSVELIEGEVPKVQGTAIWEAARLAGVVQESLGRIEIEFDAPGENDSSDNQPERQIARFRSLSDAPVTVRGTIALGVNRYDVDLWLRASPDRPDLAGQLGALGERQPDGQIRIRLTGSLGLS